MDVRACLRCSHDLTGIPEIGGLRTCPECGEPYPRRFERPKRSRWVWAQVSLVIALAPITAFFLLLALVDSIGLAMIAYPMFILCGVVGGLGATVPVTLAVLGPRFPDRPVTDKTAILALAAILTALTMALVGYGAAIMASQLVFKGRSYGREPSVFPSTLAFIDLSHDGHGVITRAVPRMPGGTASLPGTPPC